MRKRVPMQAIVLRTLYTTGILGTALVAPNAVKLFRHIDQGKERRKRLYQRIDQARHRLKDRGLIVIKEGKVTLTAKGREAVEGMFAQEYEIPEQAFWDGKWRTVVFDVRENRRKVRATLRGLLYGAGFVRLQDSVWIFPYPCDEFVELLRARLKSGVGEMLSFTVDAFAGDRHLREHFGLTHL